jgi:hypothetical protein
MAILICSGLLGNTALEKWRFFQGQRSQGQNTAFISDEYERVRQYQLDIHTRILMSAACFLIFDFHRQTICPLKEFSTSVN